jgi:hypothetical protein
MSKASVVVYGCDVSKGRAELHVTAGSTLVDEEVTVVRLHNTDGTLLGVRINGHTHEEVEELEIVVRGSDARYAIESALAFAALVLRGGGRHVSMYQTTVEL